MPNRNKQLGTGLENRVVEKARSIGLEAKKQPLSGVLKDFPNDVVVESILVECKVRTAELDAKGNRYIRLDLEWLKGVEQHANDQGYELGVLVVNAKYSTQPHVLLDLTYFLNLLKQTHPL